jgi:hypothetical protein
VVGLLKHQEWKVCYFNGGRSFQFTKASLCYGELLLCYLYTCCKYTCDVIESFIVGCPSMVTHLKHNIPHDLIRLHRHMCICDMSYHKNLKNHDKIALCASLQHELINSLLKSNWDQMSKKWVFKLGFRRTVHGQFGQLSNLRLKRINKNQDVWKNVCSCFVSFVFIVGTWDVLKGNLVVVASLLREKRILNYLRWFLIFTPPTLLPTYIYLFNYRIEAFGNHTRIHNITLGNQWVKIPILK